MTDRIKALEEITDPHFIWGALDNVHDAETTLADYAAAVSRAQRAALAASQPTPTRQQDLTAAFAEAIEGVGLDGLKATSMFGSHAAQPVAGVGGRSYRKKPVVIEAVQWTGENLREVIAFTDGPPETKTQHAGMMWEQYEELVREDGLKIYTLEGKMDASRGDWIIKGVRGEFYPCKPDIFAATYEPASQPAQPVAWGETYDGGKFFDTVSTSKTRHHTFPLYAAPQPLTVQDAARVPEIAALIEEAEWALPILERYLRHPNDDMDLKDFAAALRAIAEGK